MRDRKIRRPAAIGEAMAAGRMSDEDAVGAMWIGPASLGSTSAALGGLGGRDVLDRDL